MAEKNEEKEFWKPVMEKGTGDQSEKANSIGNTVSVEAVTESSISGLQTALFLLRFLPKIAFSNSAETALYEPKSSAFDNFSNFSKIKCRNGKPIAPSK